MVDKLRARLGGTAQKRTSITVVDVAREAHVSPMTVSRVMNGNARVGAELRELVLEVAARIGYRPNAAGRTLRANYTTHIGVLYGNPSAAYLNQMMLGMLEEAALAGAQIQVERFNTRRSYQSAIRGLLDAHVDGVILPSPVSGSQAMIRLLQESNVVAIAAGIDETDRGISSVGMDDYKASCAITRYVLQLGHRKIAFIKGDSTHAPALLRARGFLDTMHKNGVAVPESYIEVGKFTYKSGLDAARKLLSLPDRPTAIICSNDDMAAGSVAVALGMGIDVPGEVSITGFDDTPIASTIWPQLTTVHQPVVHLGRIAVRLLIEELRVRRAGIKFAQRHEPLKYRIVRRESTGPLD